MPAMRYLSSAMARWIQRFLRPSVTRLSSRSQDLIRGKDYTFSAFVVEAVRVALENLKEEE